MSIHLRRISKEKLSQIAEAFRDYPYEEGETGIYYRCKGGDGILTYMKAFAKAGIKSGWLYTASENEEGYIMISDPDSRVSISGVLGLVKGCIGAMGFRGSVRFLRDLKGAGESLGAKLKREKRPFVQIEMLVVRKPYQNQGYIRGLVQIAFDRADALGLPCIVSTDGKRKAEKYRHLGFALFGVRRLHGTSYEYDLIRYPKAAQ